MANYLHLIVRPVHTNIEEISEDIVEVGRFRSGRELEGILIEKVKPTNAGFRIA